MFQRSSSQGRREAIGSRGKHGKTHTHTHTWTKTEDYLVMYVYSKPVRRKHSYYPNAHPPRPTRFLVTPKRHTPEVVGGVGVGGVGVGPATDAKKKKEVQQSNDERNNSNSGANGRTRNEESEDTGYASPRLHDRVGRGVRRCGQQTINSLCISYISTSKRDGGRGGERTYLPSPAWSV